MSETLARGGAERLPSPMKGELLGLQGRLLIGQNFLDSSRKLGRNILPSDLRINDQTFSPVNALSVLERTHEWRDRLGDDHDAQKQEWSQSVVRVMRKKRDYFQAEEGGKWKRLYEMLDVKVDDFTLDKANSMYGRFFSEGRKGREVESFLADILALDVYKDPKHENAINFAKIKEDLPAYAWLGRIFGQGSAMILTELLAAEARFSDVKEEPKLVQDLNHRKGIFSRKRKIDSLAPLEEGLLTYTNSAFLRGELKVPPVLTKFISPRIVELPDGDDVMPVAPPPPPIVSGDDDEVI
jgi:hypothetical protein